MTDRYNALVVVLDRDLRDDDAQSIISAIEMIKGVSAVTGNVVDVDSFAANTRANDAIRRKLIDLLNQLK